MPPCLCALPFLGLLPYILQLLAFFQPGVFASSVTDDDTSRWQWKAACILFLCTQAVLIPVALPNVFPYCLLGCLDGTFGKALFVTQETAMHVVILAYSFHCLVSGAPPYFRDGDDQGKDGETNKTHYRTIGTICLVGTLTSLFYRSFVIYHYKSTLRRMREGASASASAGHRRNTGVRSPRPRPTAPEIPRIPRIPPRFNYSARGPTPAEIAALRRELLLERRLQDEEDGRRRERWSSSSEEESILGVGRPPPSRLLLRQGSRSAGNLTQLQDKMFDQPPTYDPPPSYSECFF